MIYPDINPIKFSLKYDIELSNDFCRNCKREVQVNIPIISKDFVGFESPLHECGENYKIIVLKPRTKNIKELLGD